MDWSKRHSINEWRLSRTETSGGRVNAELDLSNYVTETDLKNVTGVDRSKFAKKVDLVSLKSNVDILDINEFKNVAINLSNLKGKVGQLDVDKLVLIPFDLNKLSDGKKLCCYKRYNNWYY